MDLKEGSKPRASVVVLHPSGITIQMTPLFLSLSLPLLIRVIANSFKLLLPSLCILLLISLLCKVRRTDGATLGVFGCHLCAYGSNYVQMVGAHRQVASCGEKKRERRFWLF